jgi:nucleotide-binding universal stress UspA family protein
MGTIVVGVDGSPSSLEALRWAVDEARIRGDRLRLVHAWNAVPMTPLSSAPFVVIGDLPELERSVAANAEHVLAAALGEVDVSDLEVEQRVVRGDAAGAILDAAQDADLLVVGSRGHGGFAGLLLGSVGHALVHHATCPVAIIRSRDGDQAGG